MGASAARMIGVHAFPNTVDVLVVYASFGVVNAILLEAVPRGHSVGLQMASAQVHSSGSSVASLWTLMTTLS